MNFENLYALFDALMPYNEIKMNICTKKQINNNNIIIFSLAFYTCYHLEIFIHEVALDNWICLNQEEKNLIAWLESYKQHSIYIIYDNWKILPNFGLNRFNG